MNYSPLLQNLKDTFIHYLPRVLAMLLFIVIAWVVFKILVWIIKRALRFSKIDRLTEKVNGNSLLSKANVKIDLTKIILVVAKWIILMVLVIIFAGIFELENVASGLKTIIAFLPTLFMAILILCLGIYVATYLKKTVNHLWKSFGIGGGKIVSAIVCYAILFITGVIVTNKLGINIDIITDNLSIILGALFLTLAIAFGLGSREIIKRLLFGFYSKKSLEVGQRIRIEETEGTIVSIENISLTLQCEDEKVVYPISMIVDKKIKILS